MVACWRHGTDIASGILKVWQFRGAGVAWAGSAVVHGKELTIVDYGVMGTTSIAARALALLLLAACGLARADVFQGGEFRLTTGGAPNAFEFAALIPRDLAEATTLELPDGCRTADPERFARGDRVQLFYRLTCTRALSAEDRVGTPWRLDAARVTLDHDGAPVTLTLTRASGGLAFPVMAASQVDRAWPTLAGEFTLQGIVHIAIGWDHLAFVLCLCLMFRGARLLLLVTTFTLGHSLSLGLAFFDVVSVPMPPVEAIIALSIVIMAREALRVDERGFARPQLVVGSFGLLHGLGFASALGELGVGHAERWPALLFFNAGVELGQIAFVILVMASGRLLRSLVPLQPVRAVTLHAVGVVGSFWLIERVAGFVVA